MRITKNTLIIIIAFFISGTIFYSFSTDLVTSILGSTVNTIAAYIIFNMFNVRKTYLQILVIIIGGVAASISHQIVYENLTLLGVIFYFIVIMGLYIYTKRKVEVQK